MISTTIVGRALWTADSGPPIAGDRLALVASSRWRRVASQVLEGALGTPDATAPGALVLGTTRLFEAGVSVLDELRPIVDGLGIQCSSVVSAGADTVAMALLEAASLAQRRRSAMLLIVELTEAAELAIAFRLEPAGAGVPLELTRVDPLPTPVAFGALSDNACRQAVSLFETLSDSGVRLDPRRCGRFEVRRREGV